VVFACAIKEAKYFLASSRGKLSFTQIYL